MSLTSCLVEIKEALFPRPKPKPLYTCLAKVPVPVYAQPNELRAARAPSLKCTMVKTSKIIEVVVFPDTEGYDGSFAVVLEDSSIALYCSSMLRKINIVTRRNLHNTDISAICPVRPSVVVMGGDDGTLIMANLETSEVYRGYSAHTDAVNSLDAWKGYIASAGRDHILSAYRIVNDSFELIASIQLSSMMTSIKLVEIANQVCVAVVGHKSTSLDFYAVMDDSLILQKTTNLCHDECYTDHQLDPVIELDDSRSHYFIAINCSPFIRVIIGEVNGVTVSYCNIGDSTTDLMPQYPMPRLVWSRSTNCMFVVGDRKIIQGISMSGKVVVEFTQACTITSRSVKSYLADTDKHEFFFMAVDEKCDQRIAYIRELH